MAYALRKLHPDPEAYTWWSSCGQAWPKDAGWRIDYHIAAPGIAQTARSIACDPNWMHSP